jgi:SAM-dependent methyltransferase
MAGIEGRDGARDITGTGHPWTMARTGDVAAEAPPYNLGMYSKLFAALYDSSLRRGERAGMAEHRRALLGAASGRVLEIGAGTGLNLPHYPEGLDLVLTEPDAPMARRIGRPVVPASAEELPFEDGSFDTAVSTLVLCTVADPARAIAEIARVLRPGGRLLFIEHVRGEGRLGRWQDRLSRPWRHVGNGCHANRDTLAALRDGGFAVEARSDTWHRMPRLVRPLVIGTGVRT